MKKKLLLLLCLLSMVGTLFGEGKDVVVKSLGPWNSVGEKVTQTVNLDAEDGLALLPGWNLVAVPGDLSEIDNTTLFEELKPFTLDRKNMVYVQALLPLQSGEPLWFYSDGVQYVKFVHGDSDSVVRGLTSEEGWQLVGVGGKDDVVLNNIISVWQWKHGRWSLLESNDGKVLLVAGKGYFVFREKVESDGLPDDWKIRYFKTTDVHADDDADGDGLTNLEEYKKGTNPLQAETYSIEVVNGVASKNEACMGDVVTITADAPAEGMAFDRWTSDNVEVADATSATTTFAMPAKNVTLTASYVKKGFTVEVVSGVADKNEAFKGDMVTITANAPADGMLFDRWMSDDVEVADATSETTTFVMPVKNVTVTASYVKKTFSIEIVSGVADKNEAFMGDVVTITADAPADGMAFDRWTSDDVEIADATSATASFVMPARNVTVTASYIIDSLYVVVDLSGGPKAKTYPVRYTNTPFNLNNDTCRKTELWLRKIPAGTFIMGSPEDELGHENDEKQHEVTLTRNYYIGVFECTQKQWKQIMNTNPSAYKGDTRPVERVTYNMIRGNGAQAGAGWPTYDHVVDSQSFMGKLQEKTGLKFDLPTEAQWEYACRAGTTTALNTGLDLINSISDINMEEVGRYFYNITDSIGGNYTEHTKVGCYLPNAWGLYDMHGNVYEWCLDWYDNYGSAAAVDPKGAKSGSFRIIRGGCWGDPAAVYCRSAYRNCHDSAADSEDLLYIGFRIVLLP